MEEGYYSSVTVEGSAYLTPIGSDPNLLEFACPIGRQFCFEFLKRSGKPVSQHILLPTGVIVGSPAASTARSIPKSETKAQESAAYSPFLCKHQFLASHNFGTSTALEINHQSHPALYHQLFPIIGHPPISPNFCHPS
ncbi:fatty acid synthase subunit beta [Puccinia sorghi]|uniref:Fatty acid synthase subunit beta n=1 Tax=Puccinia sorghi TaxID=27349 RepID=A0A0L6VIN4_9BASI|nr:fatty acid synthase subunit beta [Puccinia sorghi]